VEQPSLQTQEILYFLQSPTLNIRVEQDSEKRWLMINEQQQSQMARANPALAIYPYIQQICDELRETKCRTILQIGLGAGELNRCVLNQFKNISMLTIENEPTVVALYQSFFQLANYAQRDQLQIGDVTTQLLGSFDCVILDIYPWPEKIEPLMAVLIKRLNPAGRLYINLPAPERASLVQHWCLEHFAKVEISSHIGYRNQLFCCLHPNQRKA
jgi:spermidine synthase